MPEYFRFIAIIEIQHVNNLKQDKRNGSSIHLPRDNEISKCLQKSLLLLVLKDGMSADSVTGTRFIVTVISVSAIGLSDYLICVLPEKTCIFLVLWCDSTVICN
jgi:hypothetical protein